MTLARRNISLFKEEYQSNRFADIASPIENEQELLAFITLINTEGIGNNRIMDLIKAFKKPTDIMRAPAFEIAQVIKSSVNVGKVVAAYRQDVSIGRKILKDAEKYNGRLITFWDEDYPSRLRQIPNPPVLLYSSGISSKLHDFSVAMVGTRYPTEHGINISKKIAFDLASQGVTVVSGMAMGIDTASHEGALSAGGRSIGVLGTGIDVIYPPTNKKLFADMKRQGLLLTEYPPKVKAETYHFPQRNRIISGISIGTIVVEAGDKSGALITAKFALEQGRQLFSVPGPANMLRSKGTNMLIKDGTAHLVESAEDVIEHLRVKLAPVLNVVAAVTLPDMSEEERRIYECLENGSLTSDELVVKTGFGVSQVLRLTTSMLLKNLIVKQMGGRIGRA